MSKPVGGRGKKAPYQTVIIRVPEPLVPKIEQQIDDYRDLIINGSQPGKEVHPKQSSVMSLVSISEAKEEAKKILREKKSAKKSITKLLQVLYGGVITEEDLV